MSNIFYITNSPTARGTLGIGSIYAMCSNPSICPLSWVHQTKNTPESACFLFVMVEAATDFLLDGLAYAFRVWTVLDPMNTIPHP